MRDTLKKWWSLAGRVFLPVSLGLLAEGFLISYSPQLAQAALVPLALLFSCISHRQGTRVTAQAEARARAQLAALDAEWEGCLAQCLPVIPVLSQQLNETARHIEQAVVQVCESFSSIAARAQTSVTQSERSLGVKATSEKEAGFQSLIQVARTTLQDVLDRLVQTSTFSMKMVYKMEDVEEAIRQISGTLHEIEAIARRTKLLALNTTIEAARIGEHGKGFAVVAAEITKLAERSTRTSETIRTLIQGVNDTVHTTAQELGVVASADMSKTMLSKEEVDHTMTVLSAVNEEMRTSVLDAVRNSTALAQDIAQAVITLQFQDTVNQRVLHVVEALGEMEAVLSGLLHANAQAREERKGEDWAMRLEHLYTMAAERKVLAALTGSGEQSEGTNQLGDNVELF